MRIIEDFINYMIKKFFTTDSVEEMGAPKLRLHKRVTKETADGIMKTLTAQPPTVTVGKEGLSWRHIGQEKPPYYSLIHIWDGQSLNMDWARVWDDELEQDVYVNPRDERVISKITHWSPPHGKTYPKYEPMTSDDIKAITYTELIDVIGQLKEKKYPLCIYEYTAGFNQAIDESIKLLKRMTP